VAKQKVEKSTFQETLESLEKKYGLERTDPKELIIVSTGSLQLNQAMHVGGTALGKIVELFGSESSGKSTLCLHQMAEYQKAFPDKRVALFDYENSFDLKYAEALGVDTDKLLIYQPENQESGLDMILALIEKDLVSCVVIDSQTAAAPKAVVDGDMGDATIALQARNNSKFCLKVKGLLTIHKTTLFIISQTRDNIGSMGGDPTVTTGGKAIKFYSDIRWKVWKQNDKVNELNKTTVDVVKSKIGKPFGQAKFSIEWGKGIDTLGEIIDYAESFSIIKRSGSWYKYGETSIGQGSNGVKATFGDNPELLEEITKAVMDKLFVKKVVADVIEEVPVDEKGE
jgi:recombination protein RecA